jgi:4-hydroxythreonine-4-phosphate dehydrogenase
MTGRTTSNRLPVIGITVGDPAGIGPEISLKALADPTIGEVCRPVLIGDLDDLRLQAARFQIQRDIVVFDPAARQEGIEVIDLANIDEPVVPGVESALTGRAAAQYILQAVELWNQGVIDAVATAPISKNALKLAGFHYPGHTEFLAELTGTSEFAMSFFADKLRVVLLSTHLSLLEAINKVRTEPLAELIRFSDRVLADLVGRRPRIAVAGLNPHASEGGMFGSEEQEQITPAIELCLAEGIDVSGPYSPDTVFLRGYRGDFDLVVACYHDQATIAVKSLSFGSSVNVTHGLPPIRTSVDHGTACDIAGKGVAAESSMKAAVRLAADLVRAKHANL